MMEWAEPTHFKRLVIVIVMCLGMSTTHLTRLSLDLASANRSAQTNAGEMLMSFDGIMLPDFACVSSEMRLVFLTPLSRTLATADTTCTARAEQTGFKFEILTRVGMALWAMRLSLLIVQEHPPQSDYCHHHPLRVRAIVGMRLAILLGGLPR